MQRMASGEEPDGTTASLIETGRDLRTWRHPAAGELPEAPSAVGARAPRAG
jgi:hypothetical protein